uniref:Neurotransmitter-gated ion-channel ligand-binding domain-containing protein n=1 Tax=Cyclopterus lumpus TaxID=8103 RepID=A0A8C2ZQH3_CYCLU
MLVDKEYLSHPQDENCTHTIWVPLIEYQTLSVDTKNLRILSFLRASLVSAKKTDKWTKKTTTSMFQVAFIFDLTPQVWTDPELAWNTSVYKYDQVILPVDTIWTPLLHVTNGLTSNMYHNSNDLLVSSNGTVYHTVSIKAEVNCEVNMFNYPFASDQCPVAVQAWSKHGCGTDLSFSELRMVDGAHGDWKTDDVELKKKRQDRNYILVSLSIKASNPFITLLLPSILIILTDVVSFALPLGGGERNCFKVTLVLSFIMFLIILNNLLPGDGDCSPIIRIHFCVCLVLLVVSMLFSMVATRLYADGRLLFCCLSNSEDTGNEEDGMEDGEVKGDISVIQLSGSEDNSQLLGKVVNFLEALDAKTLQINRNQMFADKVDKTFFWFYFICGTIYFIAMTYVMVNYECSVDHFDFWN